MKTIELFGNDLALVDDEDYDKLNRHSWCISKGYAVSSVYGGKQLRMHQLVIGEPPEGIVVDHINGNRLDNRRVNLRFIPLAAGSHNKPNHHSNSGFAGVLLRADTGKFRARISINKRSINLGQFDSAEEAARVVDKKALELYGPHAKLNFPLK